MIIGLHGCKGSGKDTAADFLCTHADFTKVAFADKLKEAVAALFGIDNVDALKGIKDSGIPYCEVILEFGDGIQYSYTWREFLQRFGTEMGRGVFGDYFWIDQWRRKVEPMPLTKSNIVVPDVRFSNEATAIRNLHGKIIHITRPGYEPDGHESEEPLSPSLIDMKVINSGSIEDLEIDIYDAYKELSRA